MLGDKITKEMCIVGETVEEKIQRTDSAAMNNFITPWIDLAVRSMKALSGFISILTGI